MRKRGKGEGKGLSIILEYIKRKGSFVEQRGRDKFFLKSWFWFHES